MRRAGVAIAGVIAALVCLAAAYAAYELAGRSWDQVVSYRTPFGEYDRPWAADRAAPGAPVSDREPRVVLVIIDGLRLDVTDVMPGYQTLRQYGADMVAVTGQPSLSYPTWTTILSGADPDISGVTTNWFEGAVPVETVIDTTLAADRRVVVSAPEDFATLYEADRAQGTFFHPWTTEYMAGTYVDEAIALARRTDPALIVVHQPDTDDAGHYHGGTSAEYVAMAQRIDSEVMRLVEAFRDERTLFVITSDHGHVDEGGHGGWEEAVVQVPALFVGRAAPLERDAISQADIAPTIAAFLGTAIPAHAEGRVRAELLPDGAVDLRVADAHALEFAGRYLTALGEPVERLGEARTAPQAETVLAAVRAERLAAERADRLPLALGLGAVALLAIAVPFAFSWRAGLAALTGVLGYYLVYNTLFFIVRGHQWSLSAFNTEELVERFFYTRMAEAALAGIAAAAIAAVVYPLVRDHPKGPHERGYLGGWLALGPATLLAVVATLGVQVAWFVWAWGLDIVWRLPDMRWGFKYHLDLVQIVGLGAVALLVPVVTYLVGRFHPATRFPTAEE